MIEYDDEDRYEKDQREAARTVTKLFQQAARSKRAPLLTDLIEIIALNENDGGEERLRSSRTIRDLINLVEDDGSEQEPISKPVVQVVTNRQIMRQPRSPRDSTSPTKAAPPPTANAQGNRLPAHRQKCHFTFDGRAQHSAKPPKLDPTACEGVEPILSCAKRCSRRRF